MAERTVAVGVPEARRIARNTVLQAVADTVGKLAMLFLFGVMARQLGKSGFGAFTFGISVVIFIELAGVGVDIAIASGVARNPARARELIWNSFALKLAGGLIAGVVVAAIAALGHYSGEVRLMLAVIAVGKLIEMAAFTLFAVFRGLEDARPVAISLMLQRFAMAIVGSIGLLTLGFGLVAVAAVYLGSALLALAYSAWKLAAMVQPGGSNVSVSAARNLFTTSLPIGIGSVFGALLARVDAVILSLLTTTAVVGVYGAAYRLLEGTLFVSYAFGIAVLPLMTRLDFDSDPPVRRVVEIAAKTISLALLPVGLGMILFATPIDTAVFGAGFGGAVAPTRILGGAVAPYGLFIISIYVLVAQDRQKPIPALMAALAALNVTLNLILIPSLHASGAATAMTVTQALAAAAMFGLALRAVGGVSPDRTFLGPLCGSAAMCGVGLLIGEGWLGLSVSSLAFVGAAGAVELVRFPDDLRVARRVLRSRRAGPVAPGLVDREALNP